MNRLREHLPQHSLRLAGSVFVVTTLVSNCLCGPVFAADELDKQFMRVAAPNVLQHARKAGYENIGVLKFRVKNKHDSTGGGDSALARRLADKLERALIEQLSDKYSLDVAKSASDHAAKIPGASHLSMRGRKQLFNANYTMWEAGRATNLDAFYTGVAVLAQDLSSLQVGILVFDGRTWTLDRVTEFTIRPDVDVLVDAGENFIVRGIFDNSKTKLTESERKDSATKEAVSSSLTNYSTTGNEIEPAPTPTKTETIDGTRHAKHPLSPNNSDAPVRFEIRYDNQPQPIKFVGGQAFVKEPEEGQKILFAVSRTKRDITNGKRPRLGVVVKVNGENTAFRQTLPDAKCVPWVFDADLDLFGITGFKVNNQRTEPFTVLSDVESKSKELDYGEHAGTITITVFPEKPTPPTPDAVPDEDFALLEEPKPLAPSTLADLKPEENRSALRGLIVSSKAVNAKGRSTRFEMDSVPMMSATLRYYIPSDLPE